MFTQIPQANRRPRKRRPGRPKGITAQGERARARLFDQAVQLIAEKGYDAATLREVARRAKVSPALLYRYFPSKRAVVVALYGELSQAFARRAERLPEGPWRTRFLFALEASLATLKPHREALRALVPVLFGESEEGLFGEATVVHRLRVERPFLLAVEGASDAPRRNPEALGRLLYASHLGVVLFWLLDRSPRQRATRESISLLSRSTPLGALALHLPGAGAVLAQADGVLRAGLFGERVGTRVPSDRRR